MRKLWFGRRSAIVPQEIAQNGLSDIFDNILRRTKQFYPQSIIGNSLISLPLWPWRDTAPMLLRSIDLGGRPDTMPPKINPFRPGSPVNPDMFVGRLGEVEQLEGALFQTKADHPSHFMITGERGIGKTSLLHYLRYLASGDVALGDESLNFLVIDCDLSEVSTLTLAPYANRIDPHAKTWQDRTSKETS